MWHKAEWMGRPMRLELTRVGLLTVTPPAVMGYTYVSMYSEPYSIMIILIANGIGDLHLNDPRSCLRFTSRSCHWVRIKNIWSKSIYCLIVEQVPFLALVCWTVSWKEKSKFKKKRNFTQKLTQSCILRRCSWCNGYRRRIWTGRLEFKSWTRLIAFHIALIPLGKVWILLFSLQLWVNSRADWVLQPWWSN